MDGSGPILIGMSVGSVTKKRGGAQSRSRSRPVAILRRGSGKGGWYSGGWFPVYHFVVDGRVCVLDQLVWCR